MQETLASTFIHRVRHTPLRDVLRGQFTGRLDCRQRVAWLPKDAADLILRVVRRTRLRAMEKLDVADELVAHFADGIERGETVADLIANFGNELQAAKLIARAKRRARPPLVRVIGAFGWTCAACCIFYLLLAIRFYIGQPSPKVDYLPLLNHDALASDPSQRAWPIYFAAHREMKTLPETDKDAPQVIYAKPADKYWPSLVEWLKVHQPMLDGVRRASQLPQIDFIFGPGGSEEQARLVEAPPDGLAVSISANDTLRAKTRDLFLDIVMPDIREILIADSRVAAAGRDGARFVSDMQALLNIAEQSRRIGISGSEWPGPFTWFQAIRTASLTVADSPDVFTDAQLAQLAHLLAGPQVAADLRRDMHNDRLFFYDAVQRCYTDDSHGGGRLTHAGMDQFYHGGVEGRRFYLGAPWLGSYVEFPLALLSGGSRRQIVQEYDELMDRVDANLRLPRRLADWTFTSSLPRLDPYSTPVRGNQMILDAFVNSDWRGMHSYYEMELGDRDGLLVAIALEIYHRRHGVYPDSLAGLMPDLLPTIPADRISGDAVRYRIIRGKPVIYSVGGDLKDDGGIAPVYKGVAKPWAAARWADARWAGDNGPLANLPGDWILFPLQRDSDGD